MPSLRRTASSPFVRSSPYSSTFNGVQVARGQGQRRSSGSETATRRVLADIEWWRVTDGQCDPSNDQELEQHNPDVAHGVGAISGNSFLNPDAGIPWPTVMPPTWTDSVLPTAEFAALAIAPQTPLQRRLELETASSDSSLQATPEASFFAFGGLQLEFLDLESLFLEDQSVPPLALGSLHLASSLTATQTFSDCFSFQDDYAGCFLKPRSPKCSLLALFAESTRISPSATLY